MASYAELGLGDEDLEGEAAEEQQQRHSDIVSDLIGRFRGTKEAISTNGVPGYDYLVVSLASRVVENAMEDLEGRGESLEALVAEGLAGAQKALATKVRFLLDREARPTAESGPARREAGTGFAAVVGAIAHELHGTLHTYDESLSERFADALGMTDEESTNISAGQALIEFLETNLQDFDTGGPPRMRGENIDLNGEVMKVSVNIPEKDFNALVDDIGKLGRGGGIVDQKYPQLWLNMAELKLTDISPLFFKHGTVFSGAMIESEEMDFGWFQVAPTADLVLVASGKADLNQRALDELANRGLDKAGKWVGFDKAAAIMKSKK
jgi:hypothetical protein